MFDTYMIIVFIVLLPVALISIIALSVFGIVAIIKDCFLSKNKIVDNTKYVDYLDGETND